MNLKGRFWFSAKQKERSRQYTNFALINGEIVEYNEWSSDFSEKPFGNWDDYVYLGEGEYHHTEVNKSLSSFEMMPYDDLGEPYRIPFERILALEIPDYGVLESEFISDAE